MKTILLAFALLAFAACGKDRCQVCDEMVKHESNLNPTTYYKQSSVMYCEDELDAVNGKVTVTQDANQGNYWKKTVTVVCHD